MTMSQGQIAGMEAGGHDALATTLHSIARFLRTVRLRSSILLACLVTSGILGALYYVTAPRVYQSNASLYVMKVGSGITEESMRGASDPSRAMPTFRTLMSCERVMQLTLERLSDRFKTQFEGLTDAEASALIQASLSVSFEFNTNILDVRYRSKDPKAAAAVLAALFSAYSSFMNDMNEGSADQNLVRLRSKIDEVTDELEKNRQLRNRLKASAPDYVGTGSEDSLNVHLENIRHLTAKLSEAGDETAKANSTHQELQRAISEGRDVLQFADTLAPQMMAEALGIGTQNSVEAARINQELLEKISELQNAQRRFGPNHQDILEPSISDRDSAVSPVPESGTQRCRLQKHLSKPTWDHNFCRWHSNDWGPPWQPSVDFRLSCSRKKLWLWKWISLSARSMIWNRR